MLRSPSADDPAPRGRAAAPAGVAAVADPRQFDAADYPRRASAARLRAQLGLASATATALRPAADATRHLSARSPTRRLQPWPLPSACAPRARPRRGRCRPPAPISPSTVRPYDLIRTLLSSASTALGGHRVAAARLDAAGAYALFALGPERRLQHVNDSLAGQTGAALWSAVTAAGAHGSFGHARNVAESDLETAATALGDVTVSRETVVANAAVIVFREGLEAVLILAAITASFTGARRALPAAGADRRPGRPAGDRGHLRAGADDHRRARRRRPAAAGDHRRAGDRGAAGRHQLVLSQGLLERVDRAFQPPPADAGAGRPARLHLRPGARIRAARHNQRLPRGVRDGPVPPEPAGQRGHRGDDPRRRRSAWRRRRSSASPRSRSSASSRTRRC